MKRFFIIRGFRHTHHLTPELNVTAIIRFFVIMLQQSHKQLVSKRVLFHDLNFFLFFSALIHFSGSQSVTVTTTPAQHCLGAATIKPLWQNVPWTQYLYLRIKQCDLLWAKTGHEFVPVFSELSWKQHHPVETRLPHSNDWLNSVRDNNYPII